MRSCLFTRLSRLFNRLFSSFCLTVMFPSPSQHLENHLYFPWSLFVCLFVFLSEKIFSVATPLTLFSSPSVLMVSLLTLFIYVCSSYFAQRMFANLKFFVLLAVFPQTLKLILTLCWSLPTLKHSALLQWVLSIDTQCVNRLHEVSTQGQYRPWDLHIQ